MKIYFEDGPLEDIVFIGNTENPIWITPVNGKYGPECNIQALERCKKYKPDCAIYTNSIFAFSNKYAWNGKLKVPEIYIRAGVDEEWTRIDKLTNKELRKAHNLAKMYIDGAFSGVRL